MNKLIVIENTIVRQDAFGRYCLNDLHKAAGDLKKDSLAYWLANKQTQELIEQFLSDGGIPVSVIRGGYRARNIRCQRTCLRLCNVD